MKTEPGPAGAGEKKRATMRYSIIEGSAYSAVTGFGDSFLTPFALALGANAFHIGLLKSLPQLVNSVTQEFGAWLMERIGKRMPLILWGVFFECFVWVALLSIPFLLPLPGDYRVFAVIAITTVYAFLSAVNHPAWVSLMADVVPEKSRGEYFGTRNKTTGFAGLAALVIAGYLLGLFENVFLGFAALFAAAFAARMVSLYFFTKHYEPHYLPAAVRKTAERISIFRTDFGRYLTYSAVMMFAVYLASPFFAVYMLRDLRFDYLVYAFILGGEAVTRFVCMPYWGLLGDRFGNRTVLFATSLFVPAIPLLWLFNQDPAYLFLVQVFSGFAWAGFDLASFNYSLDSTTHANRAKRTAHLNLANGLAGFGGAAIGGALALGAETVKTVFLGLSGIPLVFLLSGVLRFAAGAMFAPRMREVKAVTPVDNRAFAVRALTIYPLKGIRQEMNGAWRTTQWFEERVKKIVARKQA